MAGAISIGSDFEVRAISLSSGIVVGVMIIRGGQPRTLSSSQVHVLSHQYQSELGRTSSAENSGVASP